MWRFKPFMPKENAGLEGRTIDVGNLKVHVRNAIAEGGFSCVYLARDAVHQSKQYALKHMICNDKESLSVVMKEISVMKRLKGHPNVVVLAASDIFDMGRTKEAIIVMDFCEKSLVSVLESRGATYYEEKQVLLIFRDVCNAVFAMHCQSPPVAHRDLKAENVLLGSDGAWKLCDFGSTSTNHKRFDKPGEMGIEEDNIRKHTTPAYRAPEMWDLLRRDIISEKVDIWALGCLLYRICYFKSAFDGESKLQVLNGNYRIPEMPKYNSSITDLIKDMLQISPDSRPDITQVWFQVNLLLPLDLQKETPNGSFSRTTTDIHMPAINTYDEVTTKMSPVTSQRIAPYSSSTRGQVRSMSARYVEERPRTSLRDSKTTGDGPLGMFWTTHHQSSTLVTENNIPKSDKELPSQSVSKHNEQKIGKRSSPSREKIAKEPPRTVRGDSVIKSDDVPSADFEIRFESGRGIGKTKISYAGNQKTAVLNSENRTSFPNETFNTFVAEFDPSKLSTNSGSRKDLQGELESLKKQLKQSNFEKVDMTSKFEKLSAICRSQRQEIQELKRSLAALNQPPSNKVNLKSQSTRSGQSSFQQREKIEGSLLELQKGVFANASVSRGKDSRAWQPFAKESKPVRTSDCRQTKSNSASIATGSWSFDQDGFTAAVSSSQTSRTSFQSRSSQQYSSSNVKKVQTTQPAGWAGF